MRYGAQQKINLANSCQPCIKFRYSMYNSLVVHVGVHSHEHVVAAQAEVSSHSNWVNIMSSVLAIQDTMRSLEGNQTTAVLNLDHCRRCWILQKIEVSSYFSWAHLQMQTSTFHISWHSASAICKAKAPLPFPTEESLCSCWMWSWPCRKTRLVAPIHLQCTHFLIASRWIKLISGWLCNCLFHRAACWHW